MLACIFIGDSTAYGAAVAYNASAPVACQVVARERLSPEAIARSAIPAEAIGTAVVGTGSNDPNSPALRSILIRTRQRIAAHRVIWLLPYNRVAAYHVRSVAVAYGDFVLDLADVPGIPEPRYPERGLVHPRSYNGIAIALRRWPIQ